MKSKYPGHKRCYLVYLESESAHFDFLVWSMSQEGFKIYTVASHQVVIETLWLHFQGAVMSSIF